MTVRRAILIPNTFQTPNTYVDELLPILTGTEIKVLIFVARKTFGWGKPSEALTIAEIMVAVAGSRSGVSAALNRLVAMCVITREGEPGYEFRYALQLDKSLFLLPGAAEGCAESTQPPADPHPEIYMGSPKNLDDPHPETEGGTPYTLNPPSKTQEETQGDGENIARPPLREIRPVLRPRELEAAAQADSPSWRALVREADALPVLGAEHERWTATWRNLRDWAARAGLDDDALAAEIHARARRYHRQFTTPYTTPALGANWAALAHDPPPRPEGAPARASPGDTEALIAAQPKLTRANIEAGRRFLERRGHGLRGIPGLPDPAGGRDEQVPERRADRAVVADVRALPPGDVRDGGQSGGG